MAKLDDIKIDLEVHSDQITKLIQQITDVTISTTTAMKQLGITHQASPSAPIPKTMSTFRSWCIGGPLDCQWKHWSPARHQFVKNEQDGRNGTYEHGGQLEDDQGEYQIYKWIGWDHYPKLYSGVIKLLGDVKLNGVSVTNGQTFTIKYDEFTLD